MKNLNYYANRGTETVEFDIERDKSYPYPITRCVVDVDILVCGNGICTCADGGFYRMNDAEQTAALLFVELKRRARAGKGVKTFEKLKASGVNSFLDFIDPQDLVDTEFVDYFRNQMPPVTDKARLVQLGDAYSHEDANGVEHPTYPTFSRVNETTWMYNGICFMESTENQVYCANTVRAALKKLGCNI